MAKKPRLYMPSRDSVKGSVVLSMLLTLAWLIIVIGIVGVVVLVLVVTIRISVRRTIMTVI